MQLGVGRLDLGLLGLLGLVQPDGLLGLVQVIPAWTVMAES